MSRMTEITGATRLALSNDNIISELFDDEMVVVDLDTGRYFSIDLIGATILDLLAAGHSVGAVAESLAPRYDAPAAEVAAGVTRFAAELVETALLCPSDAAVSAPIPESSTTAPENFSSPVLTAYADMQDLLLLDPIHDVDATGWPVRPDAAG